ncbi:MAG: hypothetical protein Q8Q86_02790 [Candidatus Daviesbacteria bacterium]|nr:hypothetical protein [Candidatus Daviesbacteria bacterium]
MKKVRMEAWEFYQKWRKQKTYSPALKTEVRVSLKGWAHLSGSDKVRRKRTYQDAYRRYKLLPYAKEIIETSTTIQNITEKRKRKFYALEAIIKVSYNDKKENRKIKVILIEDQLGNKIFYSVMDRRIKNAY